MTFEDDTPPRRIRPADLREVLIIALGIGLAFSVDALWGELQQGREADGMLVAVQDELTENAAQLRASAEVAQQSADAGLALLALTGPDAEPEAEARFFALMGRVWVFPVDQYQDAALTTLVTSGGLPRVTDADLRGALAVWPSYLEGLEDGQRGLQTHFDTNVRTQLWRHVPQLEVELRSGFLNDEDLGERFRGAIPDRSRFPDDPLALLEDMAFQNALVQHTTMMMFLAERVDRLADEGEALARAVQSAR